MKSVSKSLSNDGYQMESHNRTTKNLPLTSTITVTNCPPNTTVGPDPTHYGMDCVSWTALNDLMEMTQVKCWNSHVQNENTEANTKGQKYLASMESFCFQKSKPLHFCSQSFRKRG